MAGTLVMASLVTAEDGELMTVHVDDQFDLFAIYASADASWVNRRGMLIRPAGEFGYDVFVSYRRQEPDRTWVRETLVPRLRAEGLRVCIDDESFRAGEPLVLEIARAVERSRYTLAVLSPAYLQGNFAELENVLAEHLGVEQGQRRLLLVMREPCTPRLGLRARLWLDLIDDADFEPGVTRLVDELRRPVEPER
jgi:hypothetical protein